MKLKFNNADRVMIGFCTFWAVTLAFVLAYFGHNAAEITTCVFVTISAIVVIIKENSVGFRAWLRKR